MSSVPIPQTDKNSEEWGRIFRKVAETFFCTLATALAVAAANGVIKSIERE